MFIDRLISRMWGKPWSVCTITMPPTAGEMMYSQSTVSFVKVDLVCSTIDIEVEKNKAVESHSGKWSRKEYKVERLREFNRNCFETTMQKWKRNTLYGTRTCNLQITQISAGGREWGPIAQWIAFSLHTQWPQVQTLAFPKFIPRNFSKKNCLHANCCQVDRQHCCLEQ